MYKRQTTPWTLPSNVALCVNPDETYAKVKAADGYTYYMAQALLDTVLGKLADKEAGTLAYEVLETFPGKKMCIRDRGKSRFFKGIWLCQPGGNPVGSGDQYADSALHGVFVGRLAGLGGKGA